MQRWNRVEEAFEDFYYHCDDLSSVRALSDDEGELVELYDYHEYGLPTITDPNTIVNGRPALLASSAFGNPFLFTGQTYDAETRLYHYRTRPYEPRMGRFISIDSIGVWGDEANLGNGYAYVGNRPGEWADPWGLAPDNVSPFPGDFMPAPPPASSPSTPIYGPPAPQMVPLGPHPPHLDPHHPFNDKSNGCGVLRHRRKRGTLGPDDDGHSWIQIPDPGRWVPPIRNPDSHKQIGHYPGGFMTPHPANSAPGMSDPAFGPTSTRPTEVLPNRASTPLRWGPGQGKMPRDATCEEIRRCLFECDPGLWIKGFCHAAADRCLKGCGLKAL